MKYIKYLTVIVFLYQLPLIVFASQINHVDDSKGYITINIRFKEAKKNDSLFLAIDNILYKNSDKNNIGWYSATGKNKWFRFVIPVKDKFGYWDLYKTRTFTAQGSGSNHLILMQDFFWEMGDNIDIELSNKETQVGIYSTYKFQGKGSTKYTARKFADSAYLATDLPERSTFKEFDGELNFHQYDKKAIINGLKILEVYKSRLSKVSYEVLKADIIYKGNTGYDFPRRISNFYLKTIANANDSTKVKFIENYRRQFGINDGSLNAMSLGQSRNYLFFLCNKFKYESYFLGQGFDSNWVIENIIKNSAGIIRERVLLATFLSIQKFNNVDLLYAQVRPLISDPICLSALNRLQMAAPGKPFVNFNLPDTSGKRVRLSDFVGKTVLIDFWFNGCPGCAKFYKNTLIKIESDFKESDQVVFISICGDISKKRWFDGIKGGDYTSNASVNLFTDGKGFKHPIVVDNIGGGFPFVVLIDKSGVIQYLNSPELYTYSGLTKAIKSL